MRSTPVQHPSSAELAPASITICGRPNRDTIVALLDVAMSAGLGVIVQPRPSAPSLLLPERTEAVVEAERVRRAAPRRSRGGGRRPTLKATASSTALGPAVLALLKAHGAMKTTAIARQVHTSVFKARRTLVGLARQRLVVHTGATNSSKWQLAPTATVKPGERLADTRRRAEEEYVAVSVGKGSVSAAVEELKRR